MLTACDCSIIPDDSFATYLALHNSSKRIWLCASDRGHGGVHDCSACERCERIEARAAARRRRRRKSWEVGIPGLRSV